MRSPSPGLLASAALLAASLAAPGGAYVGRWTTWTDLNPVIAMAEHQGRLYVGSTGGIRSLDPGTLQETTFDNLAGLADIRIVGFAEDADRRLWAASRSGLLFRLEGKTWSAWGRSYKASGWTVNDRALLAVGDHLVIGSSQGLTFFDRKRGVAAANLTRFGAAGSASVTGLARIGDTLFISDGKNVLKAAVDWADPLSSRFGTIFDPQIWRTAEGVLSPLGLAGFAAKRAAPYARRAAADTVDTTGAGGGGTPVDTVARIDSLQGRPVHLAVVDGKVVAHDTGTLLPGPRRVKAIKGRKLVVDGVAWPETTLTVAQVAGGRLFLGGDRALLRLPDGGRPEPVPTPRSFPGSQPASIAARDGRVAVHTTDRIYAFQSGAWRLASDANLYSPEQLSNELRNLRYLPGGSLLSGEWGYGLIRFRPAGATVWNTESDAACLPPAVPPSFTVVLTLDARGDDVWMALMAEAPGGTKPDFHWLAHVDLATDSVSCPETRGRGYKSHALRILRDDLFASAGEAGIDLFKWGKAAGKTAATPWASIKRDGGQAVGRDAALDRHGRLWVLFSEQLGYVEKVDSLVGAGVASLPFQVPENVPVKTCRDMETDPRGGLWIACDNGLFHVRPGADASAPEFDRYTSDNGLASNRVLDVAIDPADGAVWAVTEGGVSRLEGPAPPPAAGLSGARAYPNPFLARHRFLVIDGLPPGAEAAILTQSGSVVRRFRGAEMRGNQFQWDGTNAAGRAVKPGVYFYSVSAGGRSARGKIIVAR